MSYRPWNPGLIFCPAIMSGSMRENAPVSMFSVPIASQHSWLPSYQEERLGLFNPILATTLTLETCPSYQKKQWVIKDNFKINLCNMYDLKWGWPICGHRGCICMPSNFPLGPLSTPSWNFPILNKTGNVWERVSALKCSNQIVLCDPPKSLPMTKFSVLEGAHVLRGSHLSKY